MYPTTLIVPTVTSDRLRDGGNRRLALGRRVSPRRGVRRLRAAAVPDVVMSPGR